MCLQRWLRLPFRLHFGNRQRVCSGLLQLAGCEPVHALPRANLRRVDGTDECGVQRPVSWRHVWWRERAHDEQLQRQLCRGVLLSRRLH